MKHELSYVLPMIQNEIHDTFSFHSNIGCMNCVASSVSSNGYYGYQKVPSNDESYESENFKVKKYWENVNKMDNTSSLQQMDYDDTVVRRKRKMDEPVDNETNEKRICYNQK